jgi:CubicO group peptidase (beta-lactamase class C family)
MPPTKLLSHFGLAACAALLCAAAPQKKAEKDGTLVAGELGARLDEAVRSAGGADLWGAVLVAQGGEILLAKGYGKADYAEADCTPRTLFELASVSKQLTAAAVLHLEQKKKLKLSDALPEFFDDVPADKEAITLHQLLTHTAGISGMVGVPYSSPLARGEYVKEMLGKPLASPPGERFEYANVGYALLAAVVEEVTGKPFEDYLEQQIFKPAGMEDTGFIGDADLIQSGRASKRRTEEPGAWTAASWHYGWGYRGMGGIVTTVLDMERWDRALRGEKILKEKAKETLFTAALEGYACGWRVGPGKLGQSMAQHSGGVAGYGTNVVRGLQDDVLIVVLSNDGKRAYEVTAALEAQLAEGR